MGACQFVFRGLGKWCDLDLLPLSVTILGHLASLHLLNPLLLQIQILELEKTR